MQVEIRVIPATIYVLRLLNLVMFSIVIVFVVPVVVLFVAVAVLPFLLLLMLLPKLLWVAVAATYFWRRICLFSLVGRAPAQ